MNDDLIEELDHLAVGGAVPYGQVKRLAREAITALQAMESENKAMKEGIASLWPGHWLDTNNARALYNQFGPTPPDIEAS